MQSIHTVHYKAVEEAFVTPFLMEVGEGPRLDLLPLSVEA